MRVRGLYILTVIIIPWVRVRGQYILTVIIMPWVRVRGQYILTVIITVSLYHRFSSCERGDYVVEFEKNCFIAAFDVSKKVRYRCGTRSMPQLFNDHVVLLKSCHLLEKARTYRVNRQSK